LDEEVEVEDADAVGDDIEASDPPAGSGGGERGVMMKAIQNTGLTTKEILPSLLWRKKNPTTENNINNIK